MVRTAKPIGTPRNPQAVHGLPITPRSTLHQMYGASFCLSYANPGQLMDVIPLLAEDSLFVLDNGAWSAFNNRVVLDHAHWQRFIAWARVIIATVPQSVAILPDVIGGTPASNLALALDHAAYFPLDRVMPVWHLGESLDLIDAYLENGFVRIAFGSTEQYGIPGSPPWHRRIQAAFDRIDRLVGHDGLGGIPYPLVHMLRGIGLLKAGDYPFASADSTNLAQNHSLTRDQELHAARFRARLERDRFPAPPLPAWPHHAWEAPYTPLPRPETQPDLLQPDTY